jgi:hypothetical protein
MGVEAVEAKAKSFKARMTVIYFLILFLFFCVAILLLAMTIAPTFLRCV